MAQPPPVRGPIVQKCINFLSSNEIKSTPLKERLEFLEKEGCSANEILAACEQVLRGSPELVRVRAAVSSGQAASSALDATATTTTSTSTTTTHGASSTPSTNTSTSGTAFPTQGSQSFGYTARPQYSGNSSGGGLMRLPAELIYPPVYRIEYPRPPDNMIQVGPNLYSYKHPFEQKQSGAGNFRMYPWERPGPPQTPLPPPPPPPPPPPSWYRRLFDRFGPLLLVLTGLYSYLRWRRAKLFEYGYLRRNAQGKLVMAQDMEDTKQLEQSTDAYGRTSLILSREQVARTEQRNSWAHFLRLNVPGFAWLFPPPKLELPPPPTNSDEEAGLWKATSSSENSHSHSSSSRSYRSRHRSGKRHSSSRHRRHRRRRSPSSSDSRGYRGRRRRRSRDRSRDKERARKSRRRDKRGGGDSLMDYVDESSGSSGGRGGDRRRGYDDRNAASGNLQSEDVPSFADRAVYPSDNNSNNNNNNNDNNENDNNTKENNNAGTQGKGGMAGEEGSVLKRIQSLPGGDFDGLDMDTLESSDAENSQAQLTPAGAPGTTTSTATSNDNNNNNNNNNNNSDNSNNNSNNNNNKNNNHASSDDELFPTDPQTGPLKGNDVPSYVAGMARATHPPVSQVTSYVPNGTTSADHDANSHAGTVDNQNNQNSQNNQNNNNNKKNNSNNNNNNGSANNVEQDVNKAQNDQSNVLDSFFPVPPKPAIKSTPADNAGGGTSHTATTNTNAPSGNTTQPEGSPAHVRTAPSTPFMTPPPRTTTVQPAPASEQRPMTDEQVARPVSLESKTNPTTSQNGTQPDTSVDSEPAIRAQQERQATSLARFFDCSASDPQKQNALKSMLLVCRNTLRYAKERASREIAQAIHQQSGTNSRAPFQNTPFQHAHYAKIPMTRGFFKKRVAKFPEAVAFLKTCGYTVESGSTKSFLVWTGAVEVDGAPVTALQSATAQCTVLENGIGLIRQLQEQQNA